MLISELNHSINRLVNTVICVTSSRSGESKRPGGMVRTFKLTLGGGEGASIRPSIKLRKNNK